MHDATRPARADSAASPTVPPGHRRHKGKPTTDHPEGVKLHGEYWPTSERVAVGSTFETDDHAGLMDVSFTWGDVMARRPV